jgi:hypothetical protein
MEDREEHCQATTENEPAPGHYDEERDKLRRKVGVQGMRTSVLLGDSTIIKNTIEYIENKGRLKLE